MKAIKSVLDNRKMFRGGGLVPTGNPMQNMNQASGFLSSSDSLIDAVANDALSTQGGPTLSMNQGGVARFANGGLPNDFFFSPAGKRQGPVIPEYRPGIGMGVPRTRRADVTYPSLDGGTEVRNRPVTEYENFASPEEWSEMLYATGESRGERKGIIPGTVEPPSTRTAAEERYELMFPYSAQVDQGFMSMNPPIPDEISSQEAWIGEGRPRRITEIASIVPRTMLLLKNLGLRATYEGGKELHNAFEYLMQRSGSDLGHGKIRVLTNMIAAQPEFAIEIGEASNQVLGTEEGPGLSSNDFKLAVSETFFEKQKQITDAYQGLPGSEEGAGLVGAEWVSEKVMAGTDPLSKRAIRMALLGQEGSISPDDLSAYQAVMGDPAAQQTFIRELTATKGDEYVAALLAQVPEFTEEDGIVVTGKRIAEDDPEGFFEEQDRARDTSVAGFFDESVQPAESIPEATKDPVVKAQEDLEIGTDSPGDDALSALQAAQPEVKAKSTAGALLNDGTPEGAGNESVANRWAADIAEAANTDDQEDVDAKLQSYVDKFTKLIPEYEGKSEYEKGMDIVKMGMAIAAGESPNAVKNIAQGVLATIDNFTEDEEERRKYKQQVGLSAANYALEAAQRDDVAAAALAKELRTEQQFVVGTTFEHKGVTYPAGSLFIASTGDVRSEEFGKDILPNLTTEGLYEEYLDNKADVIDLTQPVLIGEGKGSPSVESVAKKLDEYETTINEARTSAKMMTMLDSSIILNAKGRATGFSSWASRKVNSLANSVGMKKELKILDNIGSKEGLESKQFRYQQQVIANMMLKEILGEGSKNVSNIDRDLAQQIVGLMSEWESIGTDPKLLNRRLQNIRSTVSQNITTRFNRMANSEYAYKRYINRAGEPVTGRMEAMREGLAADFGAIGALAESGPTDLEEGEVYIPPKVLSISEYWDFETGKLKKPIAEGQK